MAASPPPETSPVDLIRITDSQITPECRTRKFCAPGATAAMAVWHAISGKPRLQRRSAMHLPLSGAKAFAIRTGIAGAMPIKTSVYATAGTLQAGKARLCNFYGVDGG